MLNVILLRIIYRQEAIWCNSRNLISLCVLRTILKPMRPFLKELHYQTWKEQNESNLLATLYLNVQKYDFY